MVTKIDWNSLKIPWHFIPEFNGANTRQKQANSMLRSCTENKSKAKISQNLDALQ